MCRNRNDYRTFKKLPHPITIRLGDDSEVKATHYGLANIHNYQAEALYTPSFHSSLLSISMLDIAGFTATFGNSKCLISEPLSGTTIQGHRASNLYVVDTVTAAIASTAEMTSQTSSKKRKRQRCVPTAECLSPNEVKMWHRRLAHINPTAMKSLLHNYDGYADPTTNHNCTVCIQAKHKDRPIRIPVERVTKPFELIHSDVCGPFKHPTVGGHRHYIIYTDDYTRWTDVFTLPNTKKETCTAAFQIYQKRIEIQGFNIKRFRCDNGRGEYDNNLFRSILVASGVTFEPCPPYAHHKNGLAERMIQTITEKARAMMLDSQAPIGFWGEAVNTAVYLHQRTPNEGLRREKRQYLTPYEMLHAHGKPISDSDGNEISYKAPLHHLRRFGCYVSRRIPEPQRTDSKMGARSKPGCMMVGYVHNSTTLWRIWDPEFKAVKSQSEVIFNEERNAYSSEPCPQAGKNHEEDMFSLKSNEYQPVADEATNTSGTGDGNIRGRTDETASGTDGRVSSSGHTRGDSRDAEIPDGAANDRGRTEESTRMMTRSMTRATSMAELIARALNAEANADGDPLTLQEATEGPEKAQWQRAIQEEYEAIKRNQTYEAAIPPPDIKPISSKWVFKKKRNPDGSTRYKARLVIRGFEQTEYGETYAPVGKLTTFRYMISEAAQHGLEVDHLDVVTAFLNPEVDEDIYMVLPDGVPEANTIVKLKKALYGLKTAPRLWHKTINAFLLSLNFIQSEADPNLYIRRNKSDGNKGDGDKGYAIHILL